MRYSVNANRLFRLLPTAIMLLLIVGFFVEIGWRTNTTALAATGQPRLIPESFSDLAELISPSVVNIRTVKTIKGGGRVFRHFFRGPRGEEDPFNDFFRRFFDDEDRQREFKQRSLGSGFVIDAKGYIVTNNHVVENADKVQVILRDGDRFEAEVIGRDPNTDIALIKIVTDRSLPAVRMGDSDKLQVGQWVMAFGNPFGLENTVTAGIVSAKGRVIGSGPYDDFIQTDASINPGNSGGPLMNMRGEVVGISTAIVAGGQGIGFAIPINMASGVIAQLKDHGSVTRGWLGVAIQNLSGELAEYYGLEGRKGVLITEVFAGDPADNAGIETNDIILSVNDQPVNTSRALTRLIADIGVGQIAEIDVLRDGREKRFRVKIAKRDDDKIASLRSPRHQETDLGMRVSELTPEIKRRFNIPDTDGIMVVEIETDSQAEKSGMMAGDLIKEINHQAVTSLDDYSAILKSVKSGEIMTFFIKRLNAGFLVIKMER